MTTQGLYIWSKTPASNATQDGSINWAEGMAPSAVNDSARSMMARIAEWRDDMAGGIATGGTSTAYTVSSNQVFDSLAHMHNQIIAFVPNATSTNAAGADVTLNVDSLGAKPVRGQPSVALPTGTLISGTPYIVTYNNTDGAFYLHGMTNPYAIPLGSMLPYAGSTAPTSTFALPYGQAISRTTYATLFSLLSTTYGSGDGSTTFNLPDIRGRVIAGQDNMGGSAASRLTSTYFGANASTIGATGGSQSYQLARSDLPNVQPTFTGSSSTLNITSNNAVAEGGSSGAGFSSGGSYPTLVGSTIAGNVTPLGTVQSLNGNVAQTSATTCQPTIVLPFILRVI